jgi:hypothetical protein
VFCHSGFCVQYDSGLLPDMSRYHLFQSHWRPFLCNCCFHVSSHVANRPVWFRSLERSYDAINNKPQIYDMWPPALLPLRRKACWEFFALKNLTASAGFEPANLGTRSQHASSRPPKPLGSILGTNLGTFSVGLERCDEATSSFVNAVRPNGRIPLRLNGISWQ